MTKENSRLQKLLEMRADADKESIRYAVLSDALEIGEASKEAESDASEAIGYLKDVCNHGGVSGSIHGLIYYTDTHAFYNAHADECDEVLHDYESNTGEGYKFEGRDVRNILAWMGYEETARKILEEVGEEI